MATKVIKQDDFISVSGYVTLPQGSSSSPTNTTIDLSSTIPVGYMFVAAQLGPYLLPYVTASTGVIATWASAYDTSSRVLTISNRVSQWTNYIYKALFRRVQ